MEASAFDFELPPERIAQVPPERRDHSRLMVVDRTRGVVSHAQFRELPDILRPCRVFRNRAAVRAARLFGERGGGGAVECVLLHPADEENAFWCLLRPGKKLPAGASFTVAGQALDILRKTADGSQAVVRFPSDPGAFAEAHGTMPLPPYIRREREGDQRRVLDRERYQTVYADHARTVAAAAPTAGLHFTPEILQQMEVGGHRFFDLFLHVGLDTFRPIQTEHVEDHPIHRETYEVPPETQKAIFTEGAKRLAVGTTSLRTMEDFARRFAQAEESACFAEADIYIYPPAEFQATEHLLTNFHLPRSTLLCLVSAFLTPGKTDGIAWLRELYAEAIAREYRFFSYGDAMLIL